jgi:hypothetical protein
MFTRRVVIGACALCLAVPAAAGASPAIDSPQAHAPDGITAPDPPKVVKAIGPYGPIPATSPRLVKAIGPFGPTPATSPRLVKAIGPFGPMPATYPRLVNAKGPFGTTTAPSSQDTTSAATAHEAAASTHDGMDDWRTAAILEALLAAAMALGLALLLAGRPRAPRLGA